MCRGEFHRFVDFRGPDIERPAENVGEAQHVVDLVGVVRAPRGEDDVRTRYDGFVVGDFGVGVGECHDDRVGRHRTQHFGRQHVGRRNPEEEVGAVQRLGQRGDAARGGEFTFDFVDIRTVSRDHAAAVAEDHVLTADAYGDEQPCAGDGRGPGAVHDHAEFVERLAGDLYGIEHRGGRDDGRAVLVVVHHGNIQFFAQPPVDFEAFRGFDVLEVDAPECRGYRFHRADECLGIGFVDFDVEGVDVGVSFEEHAFTFHDGLACQSSDIAQSQDGRAVRNDCYQIAFVRVTVNLFGVSFDFAARSCDAGRIGQRQVVLRVIGLRRYDRDFPWAAFAVIAQSLLIHFTFSHYPNCFACVYKTQREKTCNYCALPSRSGHRTGRS